MANVKKSVADGKGLVAGAISAKGIATTGSDTFATMAGNVDKIITLGQGTGDGTAIANQILSGLVAYAKGKRLIGTMADNGAVNKSLAINSTYTVPPGYHNGLGKVTQSITTKAAQTYTPTTANQTIGAGQYLSGAQTIAGSGNLVAGNIKSGVNIFGVVGNVVGEYKGAIEKLKTYEINYVKGMTGDLVINTTFTLPRKPVYIYSNVGFNRAGYNHIFPFWIVPYGLIGSHYTDKAIFLSSGSTERFPAGRTAYDSYGFVEITYFHDNSFRIATQTHYTQLITDPFFSTPIVLEFWG